MEYILFGGGHAGAEAMIMLGRENVHCFCDNACDSVDMNLQGIPVIGFDELTTISKEYIVVISANENNGDEISMQLESYGIDDYIFFYDEVKNLVVEKGKNQAHIYLSSELNRARYKANHFLDEAYRRKTQVKYMADQFDPCTLKGSKGYIRKEQEKSLKLASELMTILRKLDIEVFALGGTLVGAVRHRGFVPWDDDIDFGIMRGDLTKLIEYAKENWSVFERKEAGIGNYRTLNSQIMLNKGKYVVEISAYCISVIKGTSIADYTIVDFFPFDYFADDYKYSDYKELILETKKLTETTNDENERLKIENLAVVENEYIRNNSNHISFSLDSMMAYDHIHNNKWINRDVIFPVKDIEFEGEKVPVPNDYKQFLLIDIPGYKGIPMDIGIPHRIIQRNSYIRKILRTVEFFISSMEDVELFQNAYENLNANGVYALYVVERHIIHRKNEQSYFEIINRINEKQIEYSEYHNHETTLGVGDLLLSEINIYKNVLIVDKNNDKKSIYSEIEYKLEDVSLR